MDSQAENPQPEKKMGWYPDPDDPERERWWDGKRWTEATQSRTPESEQATSADDLPAVAEWKTSVGFSILGIAANLLLWIVLLFLFGFFIEGYVGGRLPGTMLGSLAGAPAAIVTDALCIIYVVAFYLSYFKKRPRITSCKAISFLNFFFGGVLFGALWNANLTRSHNIGKVDKGVSYIYAIILCVLAIVTICWMMATIDMRRMDQAKSYYSGSNATYNHTRTYENPLSRYSGTAPLIFSDSASGLTFSYPSDWVLHENRPGRDDLVCDLNTKDNQCGMTVYDIGSCSNELFASLESDDLYDLLPSGAKDFKEAQGYEKRVKAKNAEFIVLSGTIVDSSGEPAYYSLWLTQHDNTAYVFSLADRTDSAEYEKALNDVMSSVSFR